MQCIRVSGSFSHAVLEGLHAAETERDKLESSLHQHAPPATPISTLVPRTQERFATFIRNLEVMLQRPTGPAALQMESTRAKLKILLGGAVKLYPAPNGEGLDAALGGDYAGLLEMAVGDSKVNVVAGKGFEPLTFGL